MSNEMKASAVTGRVIITGDLVLDAPLLIGSGVGDDWGNDKDIHVLKDKKGRAFIPGTSICGVLRDFLQKHEDFAGMEADLFGDMDRAQSCINIDDIVLDDAELTFRDGVSIDMNTGVAVNAAKYDYEAVDRGARGRFRIEVTRRACDEANWGKRREAVILLREKLISGLAVGAITAKGFGRVHAENVSSGFYDFHDSADVKEWFMQKEPTPEKASDRMEEHAAHRLTVSDDFVIEADFSLRTSLIVRDYTRKKKVPNSKVKEKYFNAVSLMSKESYVLPGTSIKGVLRHHSEHILECLGMSNACLNNLMGCAEKDKKVKSRFFVEESLLSDAVVPAGQTRIRIDRFTGSVIDSALVDNEPLWQADKTKQALHLCFGIRQAKASEAGLALLLLRELWQGNVAIGGEKAIGRGTLKGLGAVIRYKGEDYKLDAKGCVIEGDRDKLNSLVQAFLESDHKEVSK